jgi:hypothetical protein
VKRVTAVLLGLVFLALLVRLPGLGRGLWYDERFTLVHFADAPGHLLIQRQANNHPLASLLALVLRQVSEDPRVLRAPFALLGALSVFAIGCLASVGRASRPPAPGRAGRPPHSSRPAVAAALLALVHPAHVAYSQEVRGYAPLLLLVPLVTKLALDGGRPRLLAVLVALGLLAHLTILPLVLALGVLALRERRLETLAALGAGLLLGLLVLAATFAHLSGLLRHGASGPESVLDSAILLGVCDARLLRPMFALPFLLLIVLGARTAPRLGFVTLGAGLLLVAAVLVLRPVYYARFALFLLPLLLALGGVGAAALVRDRRLILLVAPVVAIFAIAVARRAPLETEPIGPALELVRKEDPAARVRFTGLGADLLPSDPSPAFELELVRHGESRPGKVVEGLYVDVRVAPVSR